MKLLLFVLLLSTSLVGCSSSTKNPPIPLNAKQIIDIIDAKTYAFPYHAILVDPRTATASGDKITAFRNEFERDQKTLIEVEAFSRQLYQSDQTVEVWMGEKEVMLGSLETQTSPKHLRLQYLSNDPIEQNTIQLYGVNPDTKEPWLLASNEFVFNPSLPQNR